MVHNYSQKGIKRLLIKVLVVKAAMVERGPAYKLLLIENYSFVLDLTGKSIFELGIFAVSRKLRTLKPAAEEGIRTPHSFKAYFSDENLLSQTRTTQHPSGPFT
ncbi:hypothetical protein SADUNF_Sadunf16G0148100 [Salix dunnii]|uniref:Uncharacterized protein n=1 Tax=Salix dunnii TaxID=1413687 RepID=A0A835MGK1_9ROSI|nr:hypothetical protein SADUNF_Sadunf16G0148100 [Salix dunnii]